jgi:hypothetical protein
MESISDRLSEVVKAGLRALIWMEELDAMLKCMLLGKALGLGRVLTKFYK